MALVPLFLRWSQFGWFVFLAVLGCGVLANLFFEALKRRDHTGLFLMLWILIPLPIVYYSHLPMKYLLPCMPAVILLCFRLMDGVSVRFARAAAYALIVASTGYSLLILHSDAEFADFGRDAMYRLISPHVAAGEKVWFAGQYWSYWYAPLAGATLTFPGRPSAKARRSAGGGRVRGLVGSTNPPLARFPHRTLGRCDIPQISVRKNHGRRNGPLFQWLGLWLWGFGDSDKDRFELWRID